VVVIPANHLFIGETPNNIRHHMSRKVLIVFTLRVRVTFLLLFRGEIFCRFSSGLSLYFSSSQAFVSHGIPTVKPSRR